MFSFLYSIIVLLWKKVREVSWAKTRGWSIREDHAQRRGDYKVRIAGKGAIRYEEGSRKYLLNVADGDGYSILVEHMGDVDPALDSLSIEERLRIALNVKSELQSRDIAVDVIMGARLVSENT